MAKVNLDAIIPREDFEVDNVTSTGKKKETISIEDIKSDSFFFTTVRKPDFQRETTEWDSKKISNFIQSFLDGDLIPAIILWRSASGYLFIIDGSHRLSALAAWINNDFGDGEISKMFYDGIIPEDQIEIAEETRKLVRSEVGSYSDYKLALTNPEKVLPNLLIRAKNLAALAIQLQWVEGDAAKAEQSFFKINQQAAPIDKTELVLLESRNKPNCIAARAIIRGGKGHKYWSIFSEENQKQIQNLAKEIHEILFNPTLQTPIKTLDLPVGGKSYSAQTLPLILDFINIVNEIPHNTFKDKLEDDSTGEKTIEILRKMRKLVYKINSIHASSFGLHPVVYFYSKEGRHKVASFYAIAALIMDFDENMSNKFIKIREKFEEILLVYDDLVQQINRKKRSALASYTSIKEYYLELINRLDDNKLIEAVIKEVMALGSFNYLMLNETKNNIPTSKFSSDTKSAVFIKDTLSTAPRCKICNGYIHKNSITIDHIVRKQDGGNSSVDNGQITHPYCNTTVKN